MASHEEYRKIYIEESDELLQQLNQNLLVLEKEPANSAALNAVFRATHTLKSMAASMEYYPIADLSHKMEDVLGQIRSGHIDISENIIDLLFKSSDALNSMANSVRKGKSVKNDVQPFLDELDKVMIKPAKVKEDKIKGGDISINLFEKKALARAKKEGYKCYHIKIILDENCVLKSVRAFMVFRNLHAIGEVIKSIPESRILEEERFGRDFDCIFITKEKKKIVEKHVMEILDIEKVIINELQVDESWDRDTALSETPERTEKIDEPASTFGEDIRKIQSVRVDIAQLDKLMNLTEELTINKLRLIEVNSRLSDPGLKSVTEHLNRLTDDLQTEVMQARLVPVSQVFDRFPRLIRDLARKENKQVSFSVVGGDIEIDRTVLDEIGDPLIHILKNAIDHGIETPPERGKNNKPPEASVILTARKEKNHVFIEIEDDGKGMNVDDIKHTALKQGIVTGESLKNMSLKDILLLTAHPGFSTQKEVTEISGRGVGLDVAKNKAESLGGSILIESQPDKGTKIIMRLPVTTTVLKALLVRITNKAFAIPVSSIVEITVVKSESIKTIEGKETIIHRDQVLPVIRPARLFQASVINTLPDSEPAQQRRLNLVIVENGAIQFGLAVEQLIGQHDIVIKQLTKELRGIRGFAGATILGDGSVALVLDVATLV